MANPFVIERELKKLPARFGLQRVGNDFKIRCPDHAGGNERTPSFIINGTNSSKFPIGSGHCFACGASYPSWKATLSRLYGGEKSTLSNADVMDLSFYDFTKDLEQIFLSENIDIKEIQPELKATRPWDDRNWRSIPSETMKAVGARLTFNPKYGERAFIPCYIHKKLVGGIFANLKKNGKRNYFNTKGDWVNTILVFYDYVRKNFKGLNTIVLVEGPRDALRLLSWGIPALALLGTAHAKNEYKYDLLSNFDNLENIILAFDGDEAGRMATKEAYRHLKDEYNVVTFKVGDNQDICSIKEKKISKLKKHIKVKMKGRLLKRVAA